MKLDKVLPVIVVMLASAFVAQVAVRYHQKPRPTYVAIWHDNPRNMAEAKSLARRIITGVVTRVERGSDLVVQVAGEPGGVDRIPVEVATITIERTHKGVVAHEVKVFHTG